MIIEAINNKAKLEKIVQGLKTKYINQEPKTREEALKPLPTNANKVIEDLTSAISFIGKLINLNNDYAKEIKQKEITITSQIVDIGIMKAKLNKLERVNQRLLKNVKLT